ncbi:MAG: dipeptidase PepE [Pyrinomonadaceae bacterium]
MNKRLLLFSNGSEIVGDEGTTGYAAGVIKDFLGESGGPLLFVPFASVTRSFNQYIERVRARFGPLGYEAHSLHEARDARVAVGEAVAIVIGGGNTFHLLREMYAVGIVEALRERVEGGAPYIGWSAGSNVACPTIKTTNDMPVVEPQSFDALNLVPFQINPHYTEARLEGHHGETRDERLAEFVQANRSVRVVGLREGSALRVENQSIRLLGDKPARIFVNDSPATDVQPADSLDFLFN